MKFLNFLCGKIVYMDGPSTCCDDQQHPTRLPTLYILKTKKGREMSQKYKGNIYEELVFWYLVSDHIIIRSGELHTEAES